MKPTVICLTPVKNEEWIIEKFLKAASIWADKIIISDQGSTDRTVEIAKQFPKVTVIDNSKLKDFNEQEMRNPLFMEARKTPGKRLLVSLDADEMFTPNFKSQEWETILTASEGTRFVFEMFHIRPDFQTVFTTFEICCAFMDDGSQYDVGLIHVPRQPLRDDTPKIKLNDIAVLHFQFTNWERMERKQLWYQMFEHINNPSKSMVKLYRAYHWQKDLITTHTGREYPFNPKWVEKYSQYGVDITSVNIPATYHWDETIIEYINKYSIDYFKRIDLRDIDWMEKAKKYKDIDISKFKLHRTVTDKLLLNYLKRTQRKGFREKIYLRALDKIFALFF